MELDIIAHPRSLAESRDHARDVEEAGFGSIWWTDSGRSAYLACTASALGTERLQIGTGIAVAFARSPMVTAGIAWELAASTGGRFVLGLGSQVKAHIERRYSAEFNPPGPRMKEYVESVKAIFRAFAGEEKLAYKGEYYDFSLLPSMWSPGPIEVPAPQIYVSAVRPYMSRLVGEVADGIHVHPFHSPSYVKEVQRTAIEEGLARSSRALDEITFAVPVMTAVGDTDEEDGILADSVQAAADVAIARQVVDLDPENAGVMMMDRDTEEDTGGILASDHPLARAPEDED